MAVYLFVELSVEEGKDALDSLVHEGSDGLVGEVPSRDESMVHRPKFIHSIRLRLRGSQTLEDLATSPVGVWIIAGREE